MKKISFFIAFLLITITSYTQSNELNYLVSSEEITEKVQVPRRNIVISTSDTITYNLWGTYALEQKKEEYTESSYQNPQLTLEHQRVAWEIWVLYLYVILCGSITIYAYNTEDNMDDQDIFGPILDLGQVMSELIFGVMFGLFFGLVFSAIFIVFGNGTGFNPVTLIGSAVTVVAIATYIQWKSLKNFKFVFIVSHVFSMLSMIAIFLGIGLGLWNVVLMVFVLYVISSLLRNIIIWLGIENIILRPKNN